MQTSTSMRDLLPVATIVGIFIGFASVVSVAQSPNPWIGTWKINLAKSTFDGAPPKSFTQKFEPSQKMTKVTVDIVGANGQVTHNTWIGEYDGKEYPVQGPVADQTRTLTRPDDRTLVSVNRSGGKVTNSIKWVLSADGKTITGTGTGGVTGN